MKPSAVEVPPVLPSTAVVDLAFLIHLDAQSIAELSELSREDGSGRAVGSRVAPDRLVPTPGGRPCRVARLPRTAGHHPDSPLGLGARVRRPRGGRAGATGADPA